MSGPYGQCECSGGIPPGCCQGRGPACFEVTRDGRSMRVCTKCDLRRDEASRRLLVRRGDDLAPFADHDPLGVVCFEKYWAEESVS